jgi:uncharacterized oxidoreductase
MKMTGTTILITGGGSGIGRGLAEALHALGNQVVIAGRRQQALEQTVAANPGMQFRVLDIENATAVGDFAAGLIRDYPTLNVLINNAGIMRPENLLAQPQDLADMEAMITTNLFGPIRLTAALLTHLQAQAVATIINVSSGLAFVPLAATPTYCATKAALHSYTGALRYQLRDSNVQVIELIPPGVATELLPGSLNNPHMMPLQEYIDESIGLLQSAPEADEVCVERVQFLRQAERSGEYGAVFSAINQMAF